MSSATSPVPAEASAPLYIRQILLKQVPIFTSKDKERLRWLPLGLVNTLHVDTQQRVIRRELLFAEGDRVDPERIAESERKLRQTGFFSRVDIRTLETAADSVDVVVVAQELWTTSVDFSYERFEDQLLWSAQVREKNFLGTARSFNVARNVDVDRSAWAFGLGDKQFIDGKWRANMHWSNADDGTSVSWSIARPFFRINDQWGTWLSYAHGEASPRLYLTGTQYIRPHGDFTHLDFLFLRRFAEDENRVWRAGFGFIVERQRLDTDRALAVSTAAGELGTEVDLGPDPRENRQLNSPNLAIAMQPRRFERVRYLFGMGQVEDIPFGHEFLLRVGGTWEGLDSSKPALSWELRHSWFGRSHRSIHRIVSRARGLITDDGSEDVRASMLLATYPELSPETKLALDLLVGIGDDLDRHRVFGLGLESGLRAARFRELAGDRLLRSNAELRWLYTPGLLDLVTPGFTVFADFGTAWFEEEDDFHWGLIRGAAGVGFRMGLNRAAQDEPIRVDLAWPLLYPSDQSSPILSIGTGHVF